MGLEYYAFALYISVLICGVLIVYKQFFSDVKRQQKLLDEKESKLLKLYRSLEDVMEEFFDSTEQAKGEIDARLRAFEQEVKMMPLPLKKPEPGAAAARPPQQQTTPAPQAPPEPQRREAAGEQPDFQKAFQAARVQAPSPVPPQPPQEEPSSPWMGMRGEILRLAKDGMTRTQIAKELNITQNEVSLVLGLNKN